MIGYCVTPYEQYLSYIGGYKLNQKKKKKTPIYRKMITYSYGYIDAWFSYTVVDMIVTTQYIFALQRATNCHF